MSELTVARGVERWIACVAADGSTAGLAAAQCRMLIATLESEVERLREDKARLDWLEATLTPNTPATEVFFAGLRNGPVDASAYQCEVATSTGDSVSFQREGVRQAIDAAREKP